MGAHSQTISMLFGRCVSVWVLLAACIAGNASGGNILVWYTEGSHWINLKTVLESLVDRGHQVTVLVPSASMYMEASENSRFHYEPFNISLSMEGLDEVFKDFLNFFMYEMDNLNYLQILSRFVRLMKTDMKYAVLYLEGLLKSDGIIAKLKDAKYDLLLADPIYPGSELVAEMLDVPLVFTLRFSMAHTWERLCGQLPAPPSYVPGAMVKLTDQMNFSERMQNFLFYASQDLLAYYMWQDLNTYYTEIRGKDTMFCDMMGRADIWLMRTYWDFDFPRPFLPNFKFVGGIHCRPAKPLPEDMEEFVQSSGDAGVVVFTLGSFVQNTTMERANTIASALAQIPQKVLWRYGGEKPQTLGDNTRIYKWIPQNDLLGHSKTRAFITHGGTNGIYEAIYHGVPMVGIPMFLDQPDNMAHMKAKGAALIMDYNSMNTKDLVDAINAVVSETSYKENAMRLSRIHHDRPISPKDEAIFWIEFTMRNKGAKHLRVQAHELTWYQYHSLDVIGFLLAITLIIALLFIKTCSFCISKCCGLKRKSKTE